MKTTKFSISTTILNIVSLFFVNLAHAYWPISPYAYTANNPVRYVDPTGMYIVESSMKDWEREKAAIQRSADRMQARMDKLIAKGGSESRIANLGERISSLNGTLGTMGTLESSSQGYALGGLSSEGLGGLSYDHGTGIITIGYQGTANFVHEVAHGGQFETGGIGFFNNGTTAGQDVYDEVAAYRAQYAYNPRSVSGIPSSSAVRSSVDITTGWVQGIVHGGVRIYNPGTSVNTGLYPVNMNSTRTDIMRAYPGVALPRVSNTTPFRNMFPIHYKR